MIKKTLVMITAFACVFSLAGCGEEEKTEKEFSVAESVEDKTENSVEEKTEGSEVETEESENNETAEIESDGQSGYATPEEAVIACENFLAMKDANAYIKLIDEETRKKFEEEVGASEKEITDAYKYCADTGNHGEYTVTTLVDARAFGSAKEAMEIETYAAEYEEYLSTIEGTGAEDTYIEDLDVKLEEVKEAIKGEVSWADAEDVKFVHTTDDTGTGVQTGMYYTYSVQGRWYVSGITESMLRVTEELLDNASK